MSAQVSLRWALGSTKRLAGEGAVAAQLAFGRLAELGAAV
jgi:hypothetical protein